MTHAYNVSTRTHTTTRPDGSTVIEQSYRDGRMTSRTGTGVIPEYYTFGVETDGRTWSRKDIGLSSSARWSKSWTDWAGRTIRSERPAFTGLPNVVEENFYDASTGRLYKTTKSGYAPTRFEYYALGDVKRTGLDVDDNGLVTASNDRIEESESLLESFQGAWWSKTEKRRYLTAGSGTATTLEITRKRLTGFPSGRQSETQITDANGNVTIATVDVDRPGRNIVRTTNRVGIDNRQIETLLNGVPVRTLDFNGLLTTTEYDGLMRVSKVIDSRGNPAQTSYYAGSTLKQSITDAANHVVATYGYDTLGRVVWQTDALGHATRSSCTLRGNLYRTWGGGTYPVEYGYDSTYGDRTSQSTFRGGTGWDAATWPGSPGTADTTTWTFDAPTGLNTIKTDALGRDERYSYNIRTQLETREWSRLVTIGPSTGQRVKATYAYSSTTGEQTSIVYNDGLTTNLTYAYSRTGLPVTITDRTGTRSLEYDLPTSTLISETLDNGYFGGRKILYKREAQATGALGRPVGYKLGTSALASMDQEVTYGYENLDRLTSVSVGTANASTWQTYRYSYRDDSNLIETLTVENKPFVVTRTYEEDRDLLTSIETKSTSPSTVYTKFSYTYDARRYRSTALQEGTAFADYGDATYRQFAYNGRGELTAGIAYLGTNVASQAAPLPGRRHEYAYDNIGNRQWSNSTGVSALRDDYSANALNQYVSRENNTVSISGTAASDSVVAVKGRNVTAGRQGRFWSDEVTVSNVLGPWAGPLSVYANKTVGGSSVMRIDSRSAAIPAVAQTLTYDLDGNTLSDGLWEYQWDAENRLVRLETAVAARSAGIAHRIINFTYDYLGRRVQKQVIDGVTVTELSSARFIFNRWDIIAEYSVLNGSTLDKLQRTFAWGVDIAGSLADAGGVGALLQFGNSSTGTAFMPSYDGNGNIASLINLGSGALAAAFEYSPFGEMLRDETLDNAVATFAFRFSTKWRDTETGWLNYGRRYYDPKNGRFIGRDPISEKGGINLYAFCGNNPVDRWDRLGMEEDGAELDPSTMTYVYKLPAFIVHASRIGNVELPLNYSGIGNVQGDLGNTHGPNIPVPDVGQTIDDALGLRLVAPDELDGKGKTGLYYCRWNAATRKYDVYESKKVLTKYAFVNGITGSLGRHVELGESHIASSFGLTPGSTLPSFTLFNNPTSGDGVLGMLGDIGETGFDKLGFSSAAAEALAGVLQANQAAGHQTMWVAHSQGGELFSEAMNIAAANGASDLSMNTVRFNAGANNWLVTNSNADNLGITVTGYYGSPLDIVPNFVGLNGNIFSIPISLIMAPTLFMSDLSPHTEPRDDWYMLQPGTGAMGPFPSPMGPFPPR